VAVLRRRWSAGAPGPRRCYPVEQGAPGGEVSLLLSCPVRVRVRVRVRFCTGCLGAFTPKGLNRSVLADFRLNANSPPSNCCARILPEPNYT
jgi:hypothetical protein